MIIKNILLLLLIFNSSVTLCMKRTADGAGLEGERESKSQKVVLHVKNILTNRLLEAARVGDVSTVKTLIETQSAEIDAEDSAGYTALICAAMNESSFVNSGGIRPAIWAGPVGSSNDYYEIARFLLEKKAVVNKQDKAGNTPILHATRAANFEIANLLLENGADVQAANVSKWDALTVAAYNRRKNLVTLFLEHKVKTIPSEFTLQALDGKETYFDVLPRDFKQSFINSPWWHSAYSVEDLKKTLDALPEKCPSGKNQKEYDETKKLILDKIEARK